VLSAQALPAVSPPALAHATAPPSRPARLLAAALVLHLAVLGLLFGLLHARRLPPAAAPQSIALVIQKAPPAAPPAAPKQAPPTLPPAHPPTPPPAHAAAMPPPPPTPPTPPRRVAANHLAARRAVSTPARALPGNPPPVVATRAGQQGQQAWVLLDVQIGPDGNPQTATIAESSGHQLLDQRARISVLQHWRFQPATLQGQPIASTIELWVSFASSD
jgi:protein TonB